jgi:hypothetical protein
LSFIEKNKVWLLPLLGLGVLGIGYMNFRTFQGDTPENAASPAAQPASPAPAPAPEVAAPASSPVSPGAEASGDLWADLQVFAVLPGNLGQESVMKDRARLALGSELGEEPPLTLEKPTGTTLAKPPQQAVESGAKPSGGAAPELEFLIQSPQGAFAWFGGHAYRTGETFLDGGYTVSRIGSTFVELRGPQGIILKYANPFYPLDKKPSNPAEAP